MGKLSRTMGQVWAPALRSRPTTASYSPSAEHRWFARKTRAHCGSMKGGHAAAAAAAAASAAAAAAPRLMLTQLQFGAQPPSLPWLPVSLGDLSARIFH